MNGLLFLLPFILVASVGLYQDSFALQQTVGRDYTDITNPDGTHTWSSHEPYVFDGSNWVPYIQSGNTITTDLATVTLNSDGSFTWNGKFTDKIVAKYADITNLNSWTYPNTLNNDTPDISWSNNQFTSSKIKSGIGQLDYKYVLVNGKWKTQLEATNLSSLTTKVFGFDQIIDLNFDNIKFGGVTRNLDNFNGTTFDKEFLTNNQGKVIDLLTGVNFDFDIGFENLYSVTVYDTGVNKSRLVFDYRTTNILVPGETLIIDPTFGYTSGTWKRYYSDLTGAISNCKTEVAVGGSDTNNQGILRGDDTGGRCQLYTVRNDISSLPTSIFVSSTTVRHDVLAISSPKGCDIFAVTNDPNSASDSTIWSDAMDGNQYASDDTTCDSTGNNKTILLSSQANNDIESLRSGSTGVFTFSMVNGHWDNVVGTSETTLDLASGSIDLEIVYSLTDPPDAVTDLTTTAIGDNGVDLDWTAPSAGGGNQYIIGYQINVTTPWTNNPLVFVNDTGTTDTDYIVTGLTWGTDYSARVSAWGNNTGGHPFNNATGNVYNFTTTYTEYATPPTLSNVFPDGYTSTSQLNLEWLAGSMDNINGYRIAREAPVGGGFSNIVSNTTNTNLYYNNTGLTTNTYYNYKIYAMNQTGISTASNTYVMTTFHLPDAVTDLVATATDLITIILDWTQPTLYGTITGYQINYTTPYGDPTTIITNSTGSSDVTYEITGLSGGNEYSFRVAPVTFHGTNTTGNIANATAFQNFEIGEIAFPTGENPDELFEITFENYEHNSTATDVQVVYDSSVDLICDFSFVNGNTNQTYSGLTENAISGSSVYSNFTLQNPNNEIIDIYCYDSLDELNNARHRLTNTVYSDIPIINQILGFQSGDYGTTGMFGAIDLITLLIVIISIIGFNRVNPAVGVIFMFMMLGIMAWFELIVVPTAILGIIILIITLAVASVKKA